DLPGKGVAEDAVAVEELGALAHAEEEEADVGKVARAAELLTESVEFGAVGGEGLLGRLGLGLGGVGGDGTATGEDDGSGDQQDTEVHEHSSANVGWHGHVLMAVFDVSVQHHGHEYMTVPPRATRITPWPRVIQGRTPSTAA